MNCKRTEKLISMHLDGQLRDREIGLLLTHIDNCDNCKKLYIEMKKTISLMRNTKEIDLPEGLETKLHFALKREVESRLVAPDTQKKKTTVKKKPNLKKWTMIAMPSAAALVAIILGINYLATGGLLRNEATNAMDLKAEFDSANYGIFGSEAQMTEEEQAAYSKTLTRENVWLDNQFVLELTYTGDDLQAIQKQSRTFMVSFEFIEQKYPDFANENEVIKAHFYYSVYNRITKYVETTENVTLRELVKPEEIYADNSYFEVQFIFKEDN